MTSVASTPGPESLATALRLVWPQWQSATAANAAQLLPEVDPALARRGYVVGAKVLQAVLPPHDGPTEVVDVALTDPAPEDP